MASPHNYFVTLLVDILAGPPDDDSTLPPRGLTLDDLDSVRYAGHDERTDLRLHGETIRRLKQSLTDGTTYPILNQEQLGKVITSAQLTDTERQRLIAGILTTKIQAELAPRISPARAAIAADRIFPLILESIQELEAQPAFGTTFKGGAPSMQPSLTDFDRAYHTALAAIDRGMLALSALPYIDEDAEKQATARQAYDAFTLALRDLTERPQTSDAWQHWQREAAQGQTDAQRHLR